MTVVLEYRSGKTEIVSFRLNGSYPARVRLRRVIEETRRQDPVYESRVFYRDRWLRTGNPVYIEEIAPAPKDAA